MSDLLRRRVELLRSDRPALLTRRQILLATPAIVLASSIGEARGQIPPPFIGNGSGLLSPPLLNQLSAGTTVIAAYSPARKLKNGVTSPFSASILGTSFFIAAFTASGLLNTAGLLSYAAGGSTAIAGTSGPSWYDQTGNGNHLARGNGNSYYCPITTPAGALNASTVVAGGFTVPLISTGYNGLSTANNGPFLSTCNGTTPQQPMPVSFGASNKWWVSCIVRLKSGTGNTGGRLGSFIHTGDTQDYNASTSAVLCALNGSTTSGALGGNNNGAVTNGTAPVGAVCFIMVVWDGAHQTLYINGTQAAQTADTATLGSGGGFSIGDEFNAGAFGSAPFAGDFGDYLIGTTLATADRALITQNVMKFYKLI